MTSSRPARTSPAPLPSCCPLPPATPFLDFCTSWKQLLNPYTTRLSSTKTPNGKRHVLRLSFNSDLVTLAVRQHLSRYTVLSDGKSSIDSLPEPLRGWARDASRDGVLSATIKVADFSPRYESTRTVGWKCGPEYSPTSFYDPSVDLNQLYGNTARLMDYIRTAAPNCRALEPTTMPDGTGAIQFIHEKRHRHELYRLLGSASPAHGIHRPPRLKFYQHQAPSVQYCSLCGEPGHKAHECTVVPHPQRPASSPSSPSPMVIDASMDDDEREAFAAASRRSGVCRDCYSHDHRESCYTPANQQQCKLCNATGHTSFRCTLGRPSWVLLPTPKPEDCRPLNLRPFAIIAQQQGRALPSWSSIASGGQASPSSQSPSNPASYAPQQSTFPPLPTNRSPVSSNPQPAVPSAQAPTAPPPAHTSSETAALRAELQEIRALLKEKDASSSRPSTRQCRQPSPLSSPSCWDSPKHPPLTPPPGLARQADLLAATPAVLDAPPHRGPAGGGVHGREQGRYAQAHPQHPHPLSLSYPFPLQPSTGTLPDHQITNNILPAATTVSLSGSTVNGNHSPAHQVGPIPLLPSYSTAMATSPPSHQ